jgi:hypothetical protein
MTYTAFLDQKLQLGGEWGFAPMFMPEFLFDFQRVLVEWATTKGRGGIFADCGLGKTPMQLVWAENVARHSRRPVLIAAPLAVSHQIVREAEKFDIAVERSQDGSFPKGSRIVVTNYERLGHFRPGDFAGMACDESSILKNFDGVRKAAITEFLRTLPYRSLWTATAAPNDYIELGTSSEALGELGYMDMLNRFFRNQGNTSDTKGRYRGFAAPRAWESKAWRFKGHAEEAFWRWVCSWARALRRPSDLGFDDDGFVLPPIEEVEHIVKATVPQEGRLFDLPAQSLREERDERRRTLAERCEQVAGLVDHSESALVWCGLNDEGDLLAKLIPDAEQVKGSDSDDVKEGRLLDFAEGRLRVLVTKPRIGAWGLNLQHCAHITFFPSHSYEEYYQGVRRCWRFGQTRPVRVDIVATEGERRVKENLQRKAAQADRMFSALVEHMTDALRVSADRDYPEEAKVPSWL